MYGSTVIFENNIWDVVMIEMKRMKRVIRIDYSTIRLEIYVRDIVL